MESSPYSDVFISYRRANLSTTSEKGIIRRLVDALRDAGRSVWIDWEDIPPASTDFSADIAQGLEAAEAFIAVLSPAYLESTYCMDMELGTALRLNKKIIPIMVEDLGAGWGQLPDAVKTINILFMYPKDGHPNTFEEQFARIQLAIEADYDYRKRHTEILLDAQAWDRADRPNYLLLRGDAAHKTHQWQLDNADKNPALIPLQSAYIQASYEEEIARVEAEAARQARVEGIATAYSRLMAERALAAMETNPQDAIAYTLEATVGVNDRASSDDAFNMMVNIIKHYDVDLLNAAVTVPRADVPDAWIDRLTTYVVPPVPMHQEDNYLWDTGHPATINVEDSSPYAKIYDLALNKAIDRFSQREDRDGELPYSLHGANTDRFFVLSWSSYDAHLFNVYEGKFTNNIRVNEDTMNDPAALLAQVEALANCSLHAVHGRWNPAGDRYVTWDGGNAATMFTVPTPGKYEERAQISMPDSPINADWHSNGRYCLLMTKLGELTIYDDETGTVIQQTLPVAHAHVAWHPTEPIVLLANADHSQIKTWDIAIPWKERATEKETAARPNLEWLDDGMLRLSNSDVPDATLEIAVDWDPSDVDNMRFRFIEDGAALIIHHGGTAMYERIDMQTGTIEKFLGVPGNWNTWFNDETVQAISLYPKRRTCAVPVRQRDLRDAVRTLYHTPIRDDDTLLMSGWD